MSALLYDPLLKILATQVDDLEGLRIASENRYRQLTSDEVDADEKTRGLGLPEDDRDVLRVRASIDGLRELEEDAIKQLQRHMKQTPWADWLKEATGVGEKSLARLLASTGDPYWNTLHNRPRQVSELWSFCGYGDALRQVKQKGQKVNWSPEAKKRLWIIADVCKRQSEDTKYRKVYLETRARYEEAVHERVCVRCGPKGKPAQPGSPLSKGHQQGRALRAISKQILLDLWLEARALHAERSGEAKTAA